MIEAPHTPAHATSPIAAVLQHILQHRAVVVALALCRMRSNPPWSHRSRKDDEDAVRLMTVLHAFDEHGL